MMPRSETKSSKLRSSPPDLKVIIGSDDNDSTVNDADTTNTTHTSTTITTRSMTTSTTTTHNKHTHPPSITEWHHSPLLASQSKYVDAMLSFPIGKEQQTLTISFPDIPPTTWHSMMKFLTDPTAARQMTASDVISVAPFYDKYEFHEGSKLCNAVLVEYFQKLGGMERNNALHLDFVIDLVILARECNLESAFKQGMGYVWNKMKSTDIPYGRTMFTEKQMTRLVPVLKHCRDNYRDQWSGDDLIERASVLDEPDFASKFVAEGRDWVQWRILRSCIAGVELSGTNCEADGMYDNDEPNCLQFDSERRAKWGGEMVTFCIRNVEEEGWVIVRRTLPELDEDGEPDWESVSETKCWVACCSVNLPLPPYDGWRSCDGLARGNPKVTYILNEKVSMGPVTTRTVTSLFG